MQKIRNFRQNAKKVFCNFQQRAKEIRTFQQKTKKINNFRQNANKYLQFPAKCKGKAHKYKPRTDKNKTKGGDGKTKTIRFNEALTSLMVDEA